MRKEFDNATTREVKNKRERERETQQQRMFKKPKKNKDYQKRVFALKKMSLA